MAKTKKVKPEQPVIETETKVAAEAVIETEFDDLKVYEITMLESSGFVRIDTLKKVSGSVAKALISKGFAVLNK